MRLSAMRQTLVVVDCEQARRDRIERGHLGEGSPRHDHRTRD
jgi:hypothetical protein